MLKCEPIYTGGGITCFLGQIDRDRYFIAEDDMYSVRILDSDPMLADEDCWYSDWQEEHMIDDLDETESLVFFNDMLNWILDNKPDGNYGLDDIERDIDEVADLRTMKNWR